MKLSDMLTPPEPGCWPAREEFITALHESSLVAAAKKRTLAESLEWFDTLVERALKRAIKAGTRDLGTAVTAVALEPEPDTPAEPFISLDDLAAIESAWRAELAQTIIPALSQIYLDGAEEALQSVLREAAPAAGATLDLRSPAAEVHLAEAENRLVGVGTSEWEKIRIRLIDGMQAGEDIDQLAKRVREQLAASVVRAKTIARTEVISASNAGGIAQVRALGTNAPAEKIWVATHDGRTRLSHAAADGQIVPIDQPFLIGGARLDFPGDPSGPADEVINCRCTTAWVTGDEEREILAASGSVTDAVAQAAEPS